MIASLCTYVSTYRSVHFSRVKSAWLSFIRSEQLCVKLCDTDHDDQSVAVHSSTHIHKRVMGQVGLEILGS